MQPRWPDAHASAPGQDIRYNEAVVRALSAWCSVVICAALLWWLPVQRSARAEASVEPPTPVLMLGNSYTRFNVLPRMLRRLAHGAGHALRTDWIAHGGYTLRRHWRVPATRKLVRSGRYRYVVLQEHSLRPVDRPAEFEDYAARFADAVRDAGAEAILYETWPRHPEAPLYRKHAELRTPPQMASRIGAAYRALAAEHGARVAPVGQAFLTGLQARPDLILYKADGAHPTWAGSYLAACVLFGAITGADPRETDYAPWELGELEARGVRELAAQVLAATEPRGQAIAEPTIEPATDAVIEAAGEPVLEAPTEPIAQPTAERCALPTTEPGIPEAYSGSAYSNSCDPLESP